MTTKLRPWYCNDALTDDYVALLGSGGDFRVLKSLKVARSLVFTAGLFGIALYALQTGAANVALVAVITIGLYNGIEVADYAALAQAFTEVKQNRDDSE